MRRFPRRRLLAALAVGLGAFGIASVVQASIPDSQGVIHGCYYKGAGNLERLGALRVVDMDRGQACRADELPVSWNQAGVSGPTGPTGPTGPSVPSYVTGSSGGQALPPGFHYVGVGGWGNVDDDVAQVVPVTGTLSHLFVRRSAAAPAPGPTILTFTLYKNGAATALTCNNDQAGTALECSDTSHTVPVAAGDTVSLQALTPNIVEPTISWAVQTS